MWCDEPVTDRERYRSLSDKVVALYQDGRYTDALELVRAGQLELPAWQADLAHLAACLLAVSGRPEDALTELQIAYEVGGWWHRRILVEDEDLASLRDLPGFAELVEASHARAMRACEEAPAPEIRRPPGSPIGLLIVLHGAGYSAEETAWQWRTAVDAGYALVAPESSQRNTPMYRSWPDPAIATRDLTNLIGALPDDLRRLPLTVAGFCAGGRQAIRWALAGWPGEPLQFIAVAPTISPEHINATIAAAAAERGLTGQVIVGENDDSRADALAALNTLRAAGLSPELDIVPGLGHALPDDFGTRLPLLLATPSAP